MSRCCTRGVRRTLRLYYHGSYVFTGGLLLSAADRRPEIEEDEGRESTYVRTLCLKFEVSHAHLTTGTGCVPLSLSLVRRVSEIRKQRGRKLKRQRDREQVGR
jgi:hypothetical protein